MSDADRRLEERKLNGFYERFLAFYNGKGDSKREVGEFMATATRESCLAEIGATAGKVWHLLDEKGSLTIAKLVKEIDSPRDVVMQALGWLAREEKLEIEEDGRTRTVSLKV
jgi:Winged helix-turn-helix domain (DUF2582)